MYSYTKETVCNYVHVLYGNYGSFDNAFLPTQKNGN